MSSAPPPAHPSRPHSPSVPVIIACTESIAPGPGHYGGSAPALSTGPSVRAGGRRLSTRPPAAPGDDTKLDRTLGDLKESLRVLRLSATAVSTVEEGEDNAKLREHLQSANVSVGATTFRPRAPEPPLASS